MTVLGELLKVGGIGALVVGAIFYMFREPIRKIAFPQLLPWQAYTIILAVLFSIWSIGLVVVLRGNAGQPDRTGDVCSPNRITDIKRAIDTNVNDGQMTTARSALLGIFDCDKFWYYAKLGIIDFYSYRFEEAADEFTNAAHIDPDNELNQSNLADALVEIHEPSKALAIYVKIDDNSPASRYKIGRAYLYESDFTKAIERVSPIDSAIEIENHRGRPRIVEAAAYMGLCKSMTVKTNCLLKSKNSFSEGVKRDPSFWKDIFTSNLTDKHESYFLAKEILKPFIHDVL